MACPAEDSKIVSAVGVAAGVAIATAHGAVRRNLAVQHLLSAARFSRQVAQIENANSGSEFGEFFEEIISYAIACVLSSAATLEAYANELFKDGQKTFPAIAETIVNEVWDIAERESTLRKFDLILVLRHQTALEKGLKPYQGAALLFRLRNALLHFKPEWSGEDADHAKLSAQLEPILRPGSPHFKGERMFPMRWMTYVGTRWVVDAAVDFMKAFEARAGLPPKRDYSRLEY